MNVAVFKSVNSVGDNSYFIRLKVDKNMYVHYDAEWEHEGQKMMDNLTIDNSGHILIQEDPVCF